MRLVIDGEQYEVRVQKRQVTYVDIMKSGKFLARGEAVLNPLDAPVASDEEGIKLAAERALRSLVPIVPILGLPFYRQGKVGAILGNLKATKLRKLIKAGRSLLARLREQNARRKKARNLFERAALFGSPIWYEQAKEIAQRPPSPIIPIDSHAAWYTRPAGQFLTSSRRVTPKG